MRNFVLGIVLSVLALQVAAQFTNQSAPFHLIISSHNKTYDNLALNPCHEGAAIEGLCPGPLLPDYSVFHLNTSDNGVPFNSSIGQTGILTWVLRASNINVSESMTLSYNPTSNVAVPLFEPSNQVTYVAFDAENKMNIQGSIDDTKFPLPPNESPSGQTKAYYRWYVCETYVGYLYTTLAWVLGSHSPQNPTCVKVTVKRVFI